MYNSEVYQQYDLHQCLGVLEVLSVFYLLIILILFLRGILILIKLMVFVEPGTVKKLDAGMDANLEAGVIEDCGPKILKLQVQSKIEIFEDLP